MTTFALEKIDIPGSIRHVYKLKRNGRCLFDDFCKEIDASKNMTTHKLHTIIKLMAQSPTRNLPWISEVKSRPKNDNHKEYEVKFGKQLRAYFFIDKSYGAIFVLGELKKKESGQQRSIEQMRAIKTEYFAQTNPKS